MKNARRYLDLLWRLNALEGPAPAAWTAELTLTERETARRCAREALPEFILGHYDRRLARRKPAIARVSNGVCGACHLRLPRGHHSFRAKEGDLDVCDHCGVFLDWAPPAAEGARTGAEPRRGLAA